MNNKILLIDDDESLLFGYKVEMELEGFVVHTATSIQEAEECLQESKYIAVITDLNLSGKDTQEGLLIISFAKKHQPLSTIMLITGTSDDEIEQRALETGAHIYLEKPVEAKKIAGLIRQRSIDDREGKTPH
ncbi:MAG: response regulator [Fibrobacteria bacterium]|nr:response regulator [Fibrobacteria bacterium]